MMATVAVCMAAVFCALLSLTSGDDPTLEDKWGLRTIVGTVTVICAFIAFAPVSWTWF